jgi:hypothetical protein
LKESTIKKMVDHPSHYGDKNSPYEAIKVIEHFENKLSFKLLNAIKYILRCEDKSNKEQDLEKAIWYIKREIEKQKGK